MTNESNEHKQAVKRLMDRLFNQGYRVFLAGRKMPDAFAVKDNKLFALDAIAVKNGTSPLVVREKELVYSGYDGIIFEKFEIVKKHKEI